MKSRNMSTTAEGRTSLRTACHLLARDPQHGIPSAERAAAAGRGYLRSQAPGEAKPPAKPSPRRNQAPGEAGEGEDGEGEDGEGEARGLYPYIRIRLVK